MKSLQTARSPGEIQGRGAPGRSRFENDRRHVLVVPGFGLLPGHETEIPLALRRRTPGERATLHGLDFAGLETPFALGEELQKE
jgi:hypothetical protein